jgi:hypothetical protein
VTALRDAAVDPVDGDFLPPVSGISPGIHGNQGVHPITPGAVSSTAATQEAAENAHMLAFQGGAYVDELVVTPATTTKAAAATQQLVATATLSDGETEVVVTALTTWTTSDATKATVNAAGLVTAVATGSATITGTYKGKTDTCVVTVS